MDNFVFPVRLYSAAVNYAAPKLSLTIFECQEKNTVPSQGSMKPMLDGVSDSFNEYFVGQLNEGGSIESALESISFIPGTITQGSAKDLGGANVNYTAFQFERKYLPNVFQEILKIATPTDNYLTGFENKLTGIELMTVN